MMVCRVRLESESGLKKPGGGSIPPLSAILFPEGWQSLVYRA